MAERVADAERALRVEDRHPRRRPGPAGRSIDGARPGRRSLPVELAGRDGHDVASAVARDRAAGPDSCAIVIPANPGWSGWTTGSCSAAAALIISLIRTMSAPSSGVSRSPNGVRVGDHVEHPAVRDVDGDGPELGDLDRRVEVGRERRDVAERDALAPCRQRIGAVTRIRPAGDSRVSSVTGSVIGRIPVSSRTVTTHIVFVPDIPGYSTCSMIT